VKGRSAEGRRNQEKEIAVTSTESLHVLIAGGGLSGLALAQGLIKEGHACDVFERDADDTRKIGYYLHMNADGGEALRRCLPADLFELYAETSRRTYNRRESVVLDDQLNELSSQPHLGPPNEGERPHTGVHRRTLRAILRARLGGSFHPGRAVVGYDESPSGVSVTLADGSTAQGDVLVGADGIRSAVRAQRLPGTPVIDAGVRGLGVFGRTPLTPELAAQLPPQLFEGVIIAADRAGSRLLISVYRPRRRPDEAAAAIAPDVRLEPVDDYVMISCSVPPGTVIPPAAEWTPGTPAMLREAMLSAIEGWHPAARALVSAVDLGSVFVIPFGFLEPAPAWAPSRVTLAGDAAHAMLPTLGLGANLALRDAARLLDRLGAAARGEAGLVAAVGAYEQDMRDYVYPFMRMTMDHDRQFGGGALEQREQRQDAAAG
jgi:2-polyprenyl-6-methoxyphenol hydroxylase-like FAD-dependent oxidoreductase